MIFGDGTRITQILTNLISNAIKFTDFGFVKFGYSKTSDNKNIEFYVSDSGIGIDKENIELIFERFKQADDRINRKYGGTGLGLSISRQLVSLMGGELWVESEPGKGSTFRFTVPLIRISNNLVNIPETDSLILKNHLENKCILIVEDEYSSFLYIESVLEEEGAKIIWSETAAAAIEIIKQNPLINLVLMDIQLPGMSGYEATAEIKKIRPELPVIAQTANAMEGDMEKSLAAGCDDYISKPISLDEFLWKINKYIT